MAQDVMNNVGNSPFAACISPSPSHTE